MKIRINYKSLIAAVLVITAVSGNSGAFAQSSSSATYMIPTQILNMTGGERVSSTYKVFDALRELDFGISLSSAYSLWSGYIPAASPGSLIAVTQISPAYGYNSGVITITDITGRGFLTGASVKFTKLGEPDMIATGVNVESSTKISCLLDLTGRSTGRWTLVVTNPNGLYGTLTNAFEVKTWATAGLIINYPNPFNPTTGSTTIIYSLENDANTGLYIYNIANEIVYKADFAAGTNGGKAGENGVSWNGYSGFAEMLGNGVYFARLVDKGTGKVLAKGKIAISR